RRIPGGRSGAEIGAGVPLGAPEKMRKVSRFSTTLVALAMAARVRAATPSPSATADFSGGGRPETITATAKGKAVRLEARDDSGKRIARADAPAPDGGRYDVALSTGSIGSSGALLEVAASSGETICRSVWRLRDGALSRLPIRGGAET